MSILTPEKRKLLEILLSKYERSKTCFGENKVNQKFTCKPDEVYDEYYSDYLDVDVKEQYDAEIDELEREGYIGTVRKNGDVVTISMVNSMYGGYCALLGVTAVHDKLAEQRNVFEKYRDNCTVLDRICTEQLERLAGNKDNSISASIPELEKILECIGYIVGNKAEILERELSIEVFSDSKMFEKYKPKVCDLLIKYGGSTAVSDITDDKKVQRERILAEYSIVKNPTYIYFKGMGRLDFRNGHSINLDPDIPIAVNSCSIADISHITAVDSKIMTVENLTSFNRLEPSGVFLLYLSGYSNKAKHDFLRLINNCNNNKVWLHFGDIDPDGFYILENLRDKTGIDFQPFCMGVTELKKYRSYTKPLEKNDERKALALKESCYAEVISFMLENNCKLEQEIVSWKENVSSLEKH